MVKCALIAGGAGFLGSHLCERLLLEGQTVVCLDDLSTGRHSNIAHLERLPGFTFVEADIREPLKGSFDRLDYLYNLACPASPIHYQADPVKTTLTSVIGAFSVLELARRTGARALQASTSEIYGDPEVSPQNELYWGRVNPTGPRACYDEGKRCAESLFFDYHRHHGVDIRVARIFNTYGPRMRPDDGRVVSNFLVQALSGQPITIYGDGLQTRSFCYVDDLVDGLFRLMMSEQRIAAPINLGNPQEMTVLELAMKIQALTGNKLKHDHHPFPQDDPLLRRPDISAARHLLDWDPKVSLDQGLRRTMHSFLEELNPTAWQEAGAVWTVVPKTVGS